MSDLERELFELRERVAGFVGPSPGMADHVFRRARIRRIINVAAGLVVVGALALGSVGVAGVFSPPRPQAPVGPQPNVEGTDALVIEITPPRTRDGSFRAPRFRASYRGTMIPLEAIETPGSELEYPRAVAPAPLAGGAPIEIRAEGAHAVAVFELLRASGQYVEHGSCIVPGAITSLPNQAESSAFFIYADWGDSVGGMAFAADLIEGAQPQDGAASPTPEMDAHLLGLAVCKE